MPSCRRKHVLLVEPSQDLLEAAHHDANREAFLLAQTGEIFDTYEAYAERMSFYQLKHFQCEVTGKSGLNYFEALESEQQEARTLHSRFPEPLKAAVLRSVQWQVMGRLDHLVEAVHDRYKDRYFADERVFIDIEGDRYAAQVMQAVSPHDRPFARLLKRKRSGSMSSDTSSSSSTSRSDGCGGAHMVGGDMSISYEESIERDDPAGYIYKVQILEEVQPRNEQETNSAPAGRRESSRMKERGKDAAKDNDEGENRSKWAGSIMDVQCDTMFRDRLVFSKSLLRRFLRECLDRDSSLASPWTVKSIIAQRFGIPTEMPENIKAGVALVRKGEIDKRKKVWEEKEAQAEREGRLTKKMIRERKKEAKATAKAADLAARNREAEAKASATARAKAERQAEKMAKEEAERLAAEKAKEKKKAIRYPTEDLDVRIGERDKKAGLILRKPLPTRDEKHMPFSETRASFEAFLSIWNFLICFGASLHISSFTLDEFEHALRHTLPDLPCNLLAEIHSVLIYNLRTVPFTRHAAVVSLLEEQKNIMDVDEGTMPSIQMLTEALADVGNNWERVPLKQSDGREGWQDALIGCLKDHATVTSFPKLRPILNKLLFEGSEDTPAYREPLSPSSSSPLSSPAIKPALPNASPEERYYALSPSDRVAILQFLCDLIVSSKTIHTYLETCEEQLTALRKEKIEINRQKKQYYEEINAFLSDDENGKQEEQPPEPSINDASDMESDGVVLSEDNSETGSFSGRRASSTQRKLTLKLKAQHTQALAKQREAERQKLQSKKEALKERKRLEEELAKCDRRLDVLERDFRKFLGIIRLRPLGRDRFYNRFWWFDGCGTTSLVASGGVIQYGTGRLFIQGPSEFDREILDRREDDILERREEEEGEAGMLGVGEWAAYSDPEEISELLTWLNPKGVRELALKNTITKWLPLISQGLRKRISDLDLSARLPEARRSQRGKNAYSEISREPYMMWVNRKALS